jgi:uncharacterized membrane protein YbhN (UPF0104 family)
LSEQARSGRTQLAIRLVGSAATLVLLYFLLKDQGWDEIGQALASVGAVNLLLALGLIFVSRLATIGRWHALLRGNGAVISPWQAAKVTFAGLFASNFLPTTIGGDVVRLAGALQIGVDGATSAASLVVDRLVGMTGMAIPLPIGLWLAWIHGILLGSTAGGASHLARLGMASPAGILAKGRAWVTRAVRRLMDALGMYLRMPRVLLHALLYTFCHMTSLYLTLMLLTRAMGTHLAFWQAAGLWSLVYFVTLMPFSVNGLGIQEVSLAFVFSNLGGVPMQSALALGIILRTMTMLASIPGALFLPEILPGARRLPTGSVPGKDETG